MTEEIEAHVLKKYEILQKLGKPNTSQSSLELHNFSSILYVFGSAKGTVTVVYKQIEKTRTFQASHFSHLMSSIVF